MSVRKPQAIPSPNKQKLEVKRSPLKSVLSNKTSIQALSKSKELFLNFDQIKKPKYFI